jgi:hypothetical protein
MYVFGGRFDHTGPQLITENIYDNRLYVFNPRDQSWSVVTVGGETPCGRRSHSACQFYLKNHFLFFIFPLYSCSRYIRWL